MTITIGKPGKKLLVGLMALAFAFIAAACTPDTPAASDSQQKSQSLVENYQQAAETAVPYPLAEMQRGGWLERRLLKENLLRQNDPHRIAYVTLFFPTGTIAAQYTIQGMVFSLNSQMTTENKITYAGCGNNCGNSAVTKSPGDNGTWGPEPENTIGFFDTAGVEHKWNSLYLESDAPDNITSKPILTYNVDAQPSVNAAGVAASTAGGIKTGP